MAATGAQSQKRELIKYINILILKIMEATFLSEKGVTNMEKEKNTYGTGRE